MIKPETSPVLDEHTAAHMADLFRAFNDTSHVCVLSAELNANALVALVGVSKSAVSHHLRRLRQMKLADAWREGKGVYYRVDDEHIITLFSQGVNHVRQG